MKNFNCVIVRYGELSLKGDNRHYFEKRLVKNIKNELKKRKLKISFKRVRGRILFYTNKKLDFIKNIFGIVSFSHALELPPDFEEVKKAISREIVIKKGKTFAIRAKRVEKIINMDSMELQRSLGSFVVEKKKAKVNLDNPDVCIFVEFFNEHSYLFTEKISGFGGLPSGVEGNVFIELKDKRDLLAALLMLKRGCRVYYTLKSKALARHIKNYENGRNLIKANSKIKIKNKKNIDYVALVLSDSLDDIYETNEFSLRPLIVYDEKQIKSEMKQFGIV